MKWKWIPQWIWAELLCSDLCEKKIKSNLIQAIVFEGYVFVAEA